MQLENRKIIICGCAMGIGEGLTWHLVKEGATVVGMDIDEKRGAAVCEEANAAGPGNASFRKCDVTNEAEVNAMFAEAVGDMGGLDALINTPAVWELIYAMEMTDEQQKRTFDINYFGTVHTNKAVFPYMKEKGGRIVNFGAGAGVQARCFGYNPVDYAASKAAVHAWSRNVAYEWGEYGITVNVVCPLMSSPMSDEAFADPERGPYLRKRMKEFITLNRYGETEKDLAPYVAFLVSEGSGYVTGQTLNVDGGMLESR